MIGHWHQWIVKLLRVIQGLYPSAWRESYDLKDGQYFDFIVVGAGSAGAIMATRLSEIPQWRVLLIEAGGDPTLVSVIPGLFLLNQHNEMDWDYRPQLPSGIGESHPDRVLYFSKGKGLGGTSSINFHLYSRGVRGDYDRWSKFASEWNWDTVLYYFKKLETMLDPGVLRSPKHAFLHSEKGPLLVSRPQLENFVIRKANEIFLEAFEELGVKTLLETNGPEVYGASVSHLTLGNGKRSSTAEAYLKPAQNRSNLFITKNARVTKVIIDKEKKRACGVEVLLKSGRRINVFADKEVILSAGSVETPKILMLSGIGPKEELRKHRIEVIKELPAVGKNLQDHAFVPLILAGTPGLAGTVLNLQIAKEIERYTFPQMNALFNITMDFRDPQAIPSFQVLIAQIGALNPFITKYFCRSILNLDEQYCFSMVKANLGRLSNLFFITLLHPESRGRIRLRSKNPLDSPEIELGYLQKKRDVFAFAEAVKFMTQLNETSYYKKVGGYIPQLDVKNCRQLAWGTDAYWKCYVINTVSTTWSPVGSCHMGPDGCVDGRLKVYGLSGLRIVDGSIVPLIASGSMNTPIMMIGEHGADIVKADYLHYDSRCKKRWKKKW